LRFLCGFAALRLCGFAALRETSRQRLSALGFTQSRKDAKTRKEEPAQHTKNNPRHLLTLCVSLRLCGFARNWVLILSKM